MKTIPLLALFPLICVSIAQAQIQIVDLSPGVNQVALGGTYTQNFDSLTSTAPNAPWTNNATLSGWYGTHVVYGLSYGQGLVSYGAVGGQGDRAFGPTMRDEAAALRFTNNSSATITGVNIQFEGEQWVRANNPTGAAPTALVFAYQIFDAGQGAIYQDTDEGWTYFSALDFVSPIIGDGPSLDVLVLDGNAAENSLRGIEAFISGLSVAPGQELWLSWRSPGTYYEGQLKNNHGLGIDNLAVSFISVPEPAATAALLGLASLSLAATRRRRALG